MELREVDFYLPTSTPTDSLVDLLQEVHVQSAHMDSMTVNGSDLLLTEDGHIAVGSTTLPATENAIRNLCKELRIPDPFAKRIPLDALQFNVHRLSEGRRFQVYRSSTGTDHWVNFADPEKCLNQPLITPLLEELTATSLNFERGDITESGVKVFFEAPDAIIPVRVNDLVSFGYQVSASDTGFHLPISEIYSLRLVCTNGAIAPRRYANLKFAKSGETAARIENFTRQIASSTAKMEQFMENYRTVFSNDSLLISDESFNRVWNGVKKTLGDSDLADGVLEIDKDTRLSLKRKIREAREVFVDEGLPSLINRKWSDVINHVTAAPQTLRLSGGPRNRLQQLGGKLIDYAIKELS